MNFVNNSYKTLFLPITSVFIVILKYSPTSYADSPFCNGKHFKNRSYWKLYLNGFRILNWLYTYVHFLCAINGRMNSVYRCPKMVVDLKFHIITYIPLNMLHYPYVNDIKLNLINNYFLDKHWMSKFDPTGIIRIYFFLGYNVSH